MGLFSRKKSKPAALPDLYIVDPGYQSQQNTPVKIGFFGLKTPRTPKTPSTPAPPYDSVSYGRGYAAPPIPPIPSVPPTVPLSRQSSAHNNTAPKFIKKRPSLPSIGQPKNGVVRPPCLFPPSDYTAPAQVWAASVQRLAEHAECRIRRVVHCSVRSNATGSQGPSHEFVVVYIRHPCGADAIMVAERGGQDEDAHPQQQDSWDPQRRSSQETLIEERLRIPVTLVRLPPADRVRLAPLGDAGALLSRYAGGVNELHTLSFPKERLAPHVAHVAALLCALNLHNPTTNGGSSQRAAWHAYTFTEVLHTIFGGDGKASKKWVRAPYGGLRVGIEHTVEGAIGSYQRKWEDFMKKLAQPSVKAKVVDEKALRKEQKKAKKKEECNAFADMLRTMENQY
ncbi:hypothetical protein CONPUDRAFT_166690 [Coniophora puteana RWD-64-598 SS2]|uniref:Uncharacterized protein n=1 Tax=Coniophora puteana (strain RWD-64-598) TaxID=741705 RepID=A0A5M3MIL8_CONPW|nr:uncharacterized protein CONPUDRAFT_166690 [Coniophora puteana RWD-64-598 SS2]EIW78760.1 hypothetical protein CONPUDRAFT_166690 [Coniophora puteana RWD-64-598 SS2]